MLKFTSYTAKITNILNTKHASALIFFHPSHSNYWGAEVFHPSDWGVASYARRIFMATDGEGLKHQQFYGKDYYAPVSNSEHVRLVKYL